MYARARHPAQVNSGRSCSNRVEVPLVAYTNLVRATRPGLRKVYGVRYELRKYGGACECVCVFCVREWYLFRWVVSGWICLVISKKNEKYMEALLCGKNVYCLAEKIILNNP